MNEPENAADLPAESPFAEVQTPRLSIWHLMLWTLCTAIYLSLIRAFNSFQGNMPSGLAAIQNVSGVLQGIFTGAVFTGAIVLVSTRVRYGPPMLRQPGHWLLFVSAVFHLSYIPFIAVSVLLQHFEVRGMGIFWLFGIIHVFPVIAYVLATRKKHALRWKLVFFGLVGVSFAQCAIYLGFSLGSKFGSWFGILSAVSSFGSLLILGAVVGVSILDLVHGQRRDWLHWTGVATHVAASSVTLLWMIASRFLRLI